MNMMRSIYLTIYRVVKIEKMIWERFGHDNEEMYIKYADDLLSCIPATWQSAPIIMQVTKNSHWSFTRLFL